MSRPALSASRCLDVIELFTSFPARSFTFSEVIRATKINTASCHAILNVLTEKGYLLRSEINKGYRLGPSLIAAGRVAEQALPIVARAERAARRLREELGVAVLVASMVGREIVGLVSLEDDLGHDAGMKAGERLPVIPPIGAPFLAWGPQSEVDAWLDRRSPPLSQQARDDLLLDLQLTRERGFHVHMGSLTRSGIGTLITAMSHSNSINDYKEKLGRAVYFFDELAHREVGFRQGKEYNLQFLSGPIFDQHGKAILTIGLGGFVGSVPGEVVAKFAERLTGACLEVMRGDRAAAHAIG